MPPPDVGYERRVSQASPSSHAAFFKRARAVRARQSEDANADAARGARSPRSHCRRSADARCRHSGGTGDSRLRSRAPSSTTPAAPAAMQPAATFGPMPPRTQTGKLGIGQHALQEHKGRLRATPAPRFVARKNQPVKAGGLRSAGLRRELSRRRSRPRPAWRMTRGCPGEFVSGGRPDRDANDRRPARPRGQCRFRPRFAPRACVSRREAT